MRTEIINGNKIVFYDDPNDMPAERFAEWQSYLLQESGMGGTLNDIDEHQTKIYSFIEAGKHDPKKLDYALQELQNQRFNYYFILNKISPKSYALACAVYSINGKVIESFTESSLKEVVDKLNKIKIKQSQIENIFDELKKKLTDSLKTVMGDLFNQGETTSYITLMIQVAVLQCKAIKNQDQEAELKAAQLKLQLLDFFKPSVFDDENPENVTLEHKKLFLKLCAGLNDNGFTQPEKMSTMQFYYSIEYMNKKFKKLEAERTKAA